MTWNFAVILIFIPFTTYEKISFGEWAGRSFTNGFSGPKSLRDFRKTGPWPCPRVLSLEEKLHFTSSLPLSNLEKFGQSAWSLISTKSKRIRSLARVRVFRRINYLSPKFRLLLNTDYLYSALAIYCWWLPCTDCTWILSTEGWGGGRVASSKTFTCFMQLKLR